MAAYNKFDIFPEDLLNGVHDLFGSPTTDAVSIYLSNATPDAGLDAVKADLAEIATGNGYTGPVALSANGTRSTGTYTLDADEVVITASGGTVGPFQYVVLFNDTPAGPVDPLIAWWDRGSALTLEDGESFTVQFNSVAADGTVFTLA